MDPPEDPPIHKLSDRSKSATRRLAPRTSADPNAGLATASTDASPRFASSEVRRERGELVAASQARMGRVSQRSTHLVWPSAADA